MTAARVEVRGTSQYVDGVEVDQGLGAAVREVVTLGDPTTAAALAKITNGSPSGYGLVTRAITYPGDHAGMDPFQRMKTSMPTYVFDAQLTYDLQPLLFEQITAETGATVTHDSTNRCAQMAFSSTPTGGKAYMQTFEHFRYQPGRGQEIFVTFCMVAHTANVLKFAGYSDGSNGIEVQSNGTGFQFVLYSDTTNGDQTVLQADWNCDPLNGTGASGLTLDVADTQIFVIDFQALYVGRVRVGFDIDGLVVWAHEFRHANRIAYSYIQSANLPVRCGMTCTGTVTATMQYICTSVTSYGGQLDEAGFHFSQEGTASAGSATRTHVLSIRPRTTFNSITNRVKFILHSVDVLVTGNFPVLWELCLGQAISGTTTYTNVNATYSAFEYNTVGTISGSPTIVSDVGYVASAAGTKGSMSQNAPMKYPITLDAAGAVRSLGTLSVIATGLGGASACRVSLNWTEVR